MNDALYSLLFINWGCILPFQDFTNKHGAFKITHICIQKNIPARDPKQYGGGSKKIMYYNVDDVNVDDDVDDDGDVDEDDGDVDDDDDEEEEEEEEDGDHDDDDGDDDDHDHDHDHDDD